MFVPKKVLKALCLCAFLCVPGGVHANLVDSMNLAPFVPDVLDAMMMVATGMYDYFVGNGDGIIYILVYTFLGMTISLGLVKMFLPAKWVQFFGFTGGGELYEGNITGFKIVENMLRPALRAFIAIFILLQVKPVMMTRILINPFLQLGAAYTTEIIKGVNMVGSSISPVECPESIIQQGWLTKESCDFMIQPIYDISATNNTMIKRGFDYVLRGLKGVMLLFAHGGQDFLDIVTGLVLIMTFFGSNLFMALLIIQGIFKFCMQLILYPFSVLAYVFKSSDKWFDIWPAFDGVVQGLKQLIVTTVACSFMLCINIAVVRALFQTNRSFFVAAAGGSASSNVPGIGGGGLGFGGQSIMWMSAILTFYLMFKIFELTQNQLNNYVGNGADSLYKSVMNDTKVGWTKIKATPETFKKYVGWGKKVVGWFK